MIKEFFLTILVLSLANFLHGQSVQPATVTAAGQAFQNAGIQLDWTLGELAIMNFEVEGQSIKQGFFQSSYTVTTIDELQDEIATIQLFPNPTADYLNFEADFGYTKAVQLQLLDSSGNSIWVKSRSVQSLQEIYSLHDLANGIYFLVVQLDKELIQTFKINKIK